MPRCSVQRTTMIRDGEMTHEQTGASRTPLSALLSLATIAGVGILIDNRFRPPEPSGGRSRIEEVENWAQRSLPLATAVSDGAAGSVSVTTFTDYECPMCRIADSVLRVLEAPVHA